MLSLASLDVATVVATTGVNGCPKLKVLGNCDVFGKVMEMLLLSGSVTGLSVTVTVGVVKDVDPELVVGIPLPVKPKDKVNHCQMLALE